MVKQVLLAEAMVGDFAAYFQGVTPAGAESIADSFRFDQCLRRQPVLDILASAMRDAKETSG